MGYRDRTGSRASPWDSQRPAPSATQRGPMMHDSVPLLGVWDRGHRVLTIGLVLAVSMAAFEALAVATILPATVADIGGLPLYGWTFSAFMLAEIVGISVAGQAGDARGLGPPFGRPSGRSETVRGRRGGQRP